MTWWIVGALVVAWLGRIAWKAYTHPAHTLGRQAANMNWIAIGNVRDSDGMRNVRLRRGDLEAVIWYQAGNVALVQPKHPERFRDFIALERWLATRDNAAPKPEGYEAAKVYYEAVESWLKANNQYDGVLALQGTDEAFCTESLRLYEVGWRVGHPAPVIGAVLARVAQDYQRDPEFGLVFLRQLQQKFATLPPSTT